MLKQTRIAFIGSGVMAEAMIKGLVGQGLLPADRIVASGPRSERGADLAERYGIQVTEDNLAAAGGRDIVVLSVKPQILGEVLEELGSGVVRSEALVLSIVAGATIERITQGLKHRAIVRVMPNTPAQIGMGMSVWTATPQTSEAQRAQARTMLAALGEELYVDHEDYLDMATALSGTGPAYVFLVMEALIEAGVHMGFSRRVSEQLVLQTMRAGKLNESGWIAWICQNSLLVRVNCLGEFAFCEISPGFVVQCFLAAGRRGRRHEWRGHLRKDHLVKIN